MSYWTSIDLQIYSEVGPTFVEDVLKAAEPYIREQNWAVEPVLEDLRKGLDDGETSFNKLVCEDLEDLLLHISERVPDVEIAMRGRGEELRDLWIREFRAGEVTFSAGPFFQDEE